MNSEWSADTAVVLITLKALIILIEARLQPNIGFTLQQRVMHDFTDFWLAKFHEI